MEFRPPMPHDLTAQPVEEMLAALRDALDVIDCGIVLLAPDMRVRFVNRRFAESAVPQAVSAVGRSFRDLAARPPPIPAARHPTTRCAPISNSAKPRSGPERPLHPRSSSTTDGDCCFAASPSPDGGRVLTYTDITWMRQQEDQQHAAHDAAERMEVEFRFNKELWRTRLRTSSRSPRNLMQMRGAPRRPSAKLNAKSPSGAYWRRNCGGWQPRMR